ncbi:hypothetical protein M885DRAFT_611192 [Pelagophyceae sp. CCMP2097]|nr:hypothetical protein M885DRAFT_611192 [Pelagophyceae sp. CCMP2097]
MADAVSDDAKVVVEAAAKVDAAEPAPDAKADAAPETPDAGDTEDDGAPPKAKRAKACSEAGDAADAVNSPKAKRAKVVPEAAADGAEVPADKPAETKTFGFGGADAAKGGFGSFGAFGAEATSPVLGFAALKDTAGFVGKTEGGFGAAAASAAPPSSFSFAAFAKQGSGSFSGFGGAAAPATGFGAGFGAGSGFGTGDAVSSASTAGFGRSTSPPEETSEADGADDAAKKEAAAPLEPRPNGEENERLVTQQRCKLYELTKEGESQAWRERGVGQCRVLQNVGDAGVVRVVMRREQTHALMLNTSLSGDATHVCKHAETSLRLTCAASATESSTYLLKLKTRGERDALVDAIEASKPRAEAIEAFKPRA